MLVNLVKDMIPEELDEVSISGLSPPWVMVEPARRGQNRTPEW